MASFNPQGDTYEMLLRLAQGGGPSLAALQAAQQGQRAMNQIRSSALSNQAGIAPGLTQRNIAMAQSQAAGQAAQAGALGRAQEQLGAYGYLGNMANAMRSGDLQMRGQDLQRSLGQASLDEQKRQYEDQNSWGTFGRQLLGRAIGGAAGGLTGGIGGLLGGWFGGGK